MHYFWHRGGPQRLAEDAQSAEEMGFDFFSLVDSQVLFRDIYVGLAIAACETETVALGPMVTNPVTRHPAVTASGIASINELAASGAFLGIGTGHSAVDSIGQQPARLADIEQAVTAIKKLCNGQEACFNDETVSMQWVENEYGALDVPVIVAAEGPKTQQMAGRVADGVIFNGPHQKTVERAIKRIDQAAVDAGRNPAEVEKWVKVRANVADDYETAVGELETSLANYASVALKRRLQDKHVPEQLRPKVETFLEQYESHGTYHTSDAEQTIASDLGLVEFFADWFGIVGTKEMCIDQLQSLQEGTEVDAVLMATEPDNQSKFIERMGRDVLPEV